MKKMFLVLSVIFFTSTMAFAADWVELYYKIYADFNSIKFTNNNHVIVWEKWLNDGYFKPIDNQAVWYIIQKEEYDCNNEQYRCLAWFVYGLKEQVLLDSDNSFSEWIPVVPDSVSEGLYNFYCKR